MAISMIHLFVQEPAIVTLSLLEAFLLLDSLKFIFFSSLFLQFVLILYFNNIYHN